MADRIPWDEFEVKYAALFPGDTGNVAKPFRMALGSQIIQNKFQYPDRELLEQLTDNPYLQYFIGLPGYQDAPPFDASTMALFRKRITADMLNEVNEYLLEHKDCKEYGLRLSGPKLGRPSGNTKVNKKQEYRDYTDRTEVVLKQNRYILDK